MIRVVNDGYDVCNQPQYGHDTKVAPNEFMIVRLPRLITITILDGYVGYN